MDRGLIDSFEIKFKSAVRNLKSAILLCALLLALCVSADAQQPTKVPTDRVSFERPMQRLSPPVPRQFGCALRERGYIEGQNIAIEYRYVEGKLDRAPELAPSWCVSRLILSW